MEKQRVNDAIVKLGNLLIKARIFVIHKLSARIRSLRRKKEQQMSQRIERLLLEIAYLKKLSRSGTRKKIARQILLNTENHAAKIEAESTSPEQRAFYRICKTKFIEKFIAKFREENVDWKYWVPALLSMWEKKEKLKGGRAPKEESEEPSRVSVKELAKRRKAEPSDVEDLKSGGRESKTLKSVNQEKKLATRKIQGEKPCLPKNQKLNENKDLKVCPKYNVESYDISDSEEEKEEEEKEDFDRNGDSHEVEEYGDSDEASSPEMCRIPFRPYAPKYFVGSEESEESDEELAKNERNNNHETLSGTIGGLSVKHLENQSMDEVEEEEEEQYENSEERNTYEEDEDESDIDSDEERNFEAKIESKFKFSDGKPRIEVRQFEPDSSEEEFPQSSQKKQENDNDDDEFADARESSFFLSKTGEQQELESRTIPKEKAPALNRRERRGHDKQKSFDEADVIDSDEEVRSQARFPRKNVRFEPEHRRNFPDRNSKSRGDHSRKNWDRGNDSRRPFSKKFENPSSRRDGVDRFSRTGDSFMRQRKSFGGDQGQPRNDSGRDRFPERKSFGGFTQQGFDNGNRTNRGDPRFNESNRGNDLPNRSHDRHEAASHLGRTAKKTQSSTQAHVQELNSNEHQLRRKHLDTVSSPGTALHPSWAAKKKLNESIHQPFQGKKTVFDD